jgi:phosphoenolpyruvate carboxylase
VSYRDCNSFVTEGVLRAALRAQSSRALRHYLDELRVLGGELSLDSRLVEISEPLAELAGRSPDRSANRDHEPYRRAITGIHARVAATAHALDHAAPRPVGDISPYRDSGELLADLAVIDASLTANGSAVLAAGRLKHLRRAVDVFGFHLAALDLRQNSDVHERAINEMLALVQPGLSYSGLGEPERIRLLLSPNSGRPGPWRHPSSAIRMRPKASWQSCVPPPRRIAVTARRPFRTTSFQKLPASPTSSKPRCC